MSQRKAPAGNTIDDNLRSAIFYHGVKSELDLKGMKMTGFRTDFIDEDGRWQREGNLGIAAYLSCDWKMAFWFGRILIEATLQKGTRILDIRPPADAATLKYLKREFAANIVDCPDISKHIPKNKNLKLHELIALTRHYYHLTWDKKWGKDGEGHDRWPQKRLRYSKGLHSAVRMLKKDAKFHGYGDPESDNGMAIWAADRIKIVRVIKSLDPQTHMDLIDNPKLSNMTLTQFEEFIDKRKRK